MTSNNEFSLLGSDCSYPSIMRLYQVYSYSVNPFDVLCWRDSRIDRAVGNTGTVGANELKGNGPILD
jgi:hypothetical protein